MDMLDLDIKSPDNSEKCGEFFRNKSTGQYHFSCFHCGLDHFDAFEKVAKHIEKHFSFEKIDLDDDDYFGSDQDIKYEKKEFDLVVLPPPPPMKTEETELKQEFEIKSEPDDDFYRYSSSSSSSEDGLPPRPKVLEPPQKKAFRKFVLGPNADNKKIFECDICKEQIKGKYDLRRHMVQHGEHRSRRVNCEFCNSPYFTKYINKHVKKMHPHDYDQYMIDLQNRVYTCPLCEETLATQTLLNKHVRSHGYRNILTCKTCNKIFKKKSELNQHVKIHLKCEECSYTTYKEVNLLKHISVAHLGEKTFQCDICAKKFARMSYLRIHLNCHATLEKTVQCQCCGLTFSTIARLKTHMHYTHTKREKKFKCGQCDKTFYTAFQRDKHEPIHSGIRPYQCDFCEKFFASTEVLKTHKHLHREKLFNCSYCDMKFAQSAGKRSHEKRIHHRVSSRPRKPPTITTSPVNIMIP